MKDLLKFYDENKEVYEFEAYQKTLSMVSRKLRTVKKEDIWSNEVFKELI